MLSSKLILALLICHIGLAFLARSFAMISTLHALLTFGYGLFIALFSNRPRNIIWITAYIVGAEVFWRMTGASIFWEFGKYAIIAILFIGFLRMKRMRNAIIPIFYFLMLVISIPLTIFAHGFSSVTRSLISFNLSGPLALAICVLYFSQIKINMEDLQGIAWAITISLTSILSLSTYSTFTSENILFTTESNFLTSGGFGPNQVSAVLGLGAVMLFLVILTSPKTGVRLLAIGLMLAFLIQTVLTFSRGGLYNAAICIVLIALHFLFARKGKISFFVLMFALVILVVYFIYPRLEQFTGGMLTQRFQDVNPTGRVQIAQAEMTIWKQNILFGVGPGIAAYETAKYYGQYVAAHTEYTRLLAEHGILGLLAIGLLIVMALRAYFHSLGWQSKLWVVAFLAWPLLEMSHAAMRIAAISFLFGLASAVWVASENNLPSITKNTLSSIKNHIGPK